MPTSPPPRHTRAARQESLIEGAPYVAAVMAALVTLVFALLVPPMLVLPALSVALVTLGFILAVFAGRASPSSALTSRYVSGALTFLGIGAALLTDVEQALPFFEGARRTP
jgi:uncharacterized membrane protein YvlD (DUF360 family)